jgi:nucleotide-binding universal stress UspA family protein
VTPSTLAIDPAMAYDGQQRDRMSPKHFPVRRILVGHDFEDHSEAALDYALALARTSGAQVTILHVYEVASMGAPEVLVMATDWIRQIGAIARERVDAIVARVREGGVPVESELRQGRAWREIDAVARERDVDLIVVGSHGRHGLPRALLGSVAEKIVRTAPCPVLVIRSDAKHEG